jgi:hypothetical protein
MPIDRTTFQNFGALGNSQAADTTVVSITPLPPGRYKIWGTCRHTLIDGIKFIATGMGAAIPISQGAGAHADFGPIVLDLNTATNTILFQLNTATGAADTASASLYAQRINL